MYVTFSTEAVPCTENTAPHTELESGKAKAFATHLGRRPGVVHFRILTHVIDLPINNFDILFTKPYRESGKEDLKTNVFFLKAIDLKI